MVCPTSRLGVRATFGGAVDCQSAPSPRTFLPRLWLVIVRSKGAAERQATKGDRLSHGAEHQMLGYGRPRRPRPAPPVQHRRGLRLMAIMFGAPSRPMIRFR